MQKAHSNIKWEDYPSLDTPLNEANLNKMDTSIDTIDDRVITLDTTKFDLSEAQTLIKNVSFDSKTGIFTFTYYNGSTFTLDTLLEKVVTNWDYDETTQQLVITTEDGNVKYVDLSALIQQNEFLDSDTVAFTVDSSGKVTAIVKEGSIEEKHLQPNYLADIKVVQAAAKASEEAAAASEEAAADSATLSRSWAVGGTDTRDGEDTDNSKYYAEQSEEWAKKASEVTGVDIATTETAGIVQPDGVTILVDGNGKVWVPVDTELSGESENPVQNKAIADRIETLTAQLRELAEMYINGEIVTLLLDADGTALMDDADGFGLVNVQKVHIIES